MKMRYRLIALIISSGLCGLLNAKDIHIAQNWELVLPVDEFVIIDFPFDIDIKTTPYKRAEMVSKNSVPITNDVELNIPSSDSDLELAQPTKDEPIVTTKTQQGSKISSININKGTRTTEFFAKKAGELEMVVWGYEKYPIMLKLKFVNADKNNMIDKYYRFIGPETKQEQATAFESQPHVDVISRISYALFNKITPKGYRKVVNTQIFTYPELSLKLRLVYTLVGSQYVGEYWEVTNLSNNPIKLHEQNFQEEGVFSVSMLQNNLSAGGTTPMYITRRAYKEQ